MMTVAIVLRMNAGGYQGRPGGQLGRRAFGKEDHGRNVTLTAILTALLLLTSGRYALWAIDNAAPLQPPDGDRGFS